MENETIRKRGRPRKVLSEEELNRPKRPRGRPRIERTEPEGPKRPRGRPRKEVDEATLNLPKRPRGRPRKDGTPPKTQEANFEENNALEVHAVINQNEEIIAEENIIENNEKIEQNVVENDIVAELGEKSNDEDDLQKGVGYIKLQNKTAGIINSKVLEPLVPAKHLSENILEQEERVEPSITTPPLVKMNISRSRTPLRENKAKKERNTAKAKPMPNKVVVVTGATSGMGFAMAKELSKLGHVVIGVGRKASLCRDAMREILDACPDASINYLVADLSIMSQVKILADDIAHKVEKLGRECVDTLILNAGADIDEQKITYENNEYMWATNYLSAVLLTKSIQHLLDRSLDARVITFTTSKAAHKTKLDWRTLHDKSGNATKKIYEQTKLADLMWALEYDHQNAENETLHAYCVDPGTVNTTLRTQNNSGCRRAFLNMKRKRGKSVEQGIETAIYLTTAHNLPKNVVFYSNKRPADPSKFALDQDNRIALWRATEIDLRNE